MQMPRKLKRGRPKRRYLDVEKEDTQEIGAREDEGFEPKCIDLYCQNAIAIESEARDPNGGNVCLFSAATCMTQCKFHRR